MAIENLETKFNLLNVDVICIICIYVIKALKIFKNQKMYCETMCTCIFNDQNLRRMYLLILPMVFLSVLLSKFEH